jgi:hypothetical protein
LPRFRSVTKTGCTNLLQHVNRVFVSAVQSSYPILLAVLRNYAFEDEDRLDIVNKLRDGRLPAYSFILVDIDRRHLSIVSLGEEAKLEEAGNRRREAEEKREKVDAALRRAEDAYQSVFYNDRAKARAKIVTRLLLERFIDSVDSTDLSLRLCAGSGASEDVCISIVDFVSCLVDADLAPSMEGSPSGSALQKFHRYLAESKAVIIPSVLIEKSRLLGDYSGDGGRSSRRE